MRKLHSTSIKKRKLYFVDLICLEELSFCNSLLRRSYYSRIQTIVKLELTTITTTGISTIYIYINIVIIIRKKKVRVNRTRINNGYISWMFTLNDREENKLFQLIRIVVPFHTFTSFFFFFLSNNFMELINPILELLFLLLFFRGKPFRNPRKNKHLFFIFSFMNR